MMFFEVCEHDSHKETILNISHKLFVARQKEQIANNSLYQHFFKCFCFFIKHTIVQIRNIFTSSFFL